MPATNIGLAIWRLKCFYGTFVQGSTAVILLNIRAKYPPPSTSPKPFGVSVKNIAVQGRMAT